MIPVEKYQDKLHDLEHMLESMGKDPKAVSSWFLDGMVRGQINMDAIRHKGMQSITLIESLPATKLDTILGLKVTEPKRRALASEILGKNEETLRNELSQIEVIVGTLRHLAYTVSQRIAAVREFSLDLMEKARGTDEEAYKNADTGQRLNELVLPTLINLQAELTRGIEFCQREHKTRLVKLHAVAWKRNWQGKYQGKNMAKRRQRLAALRKKADEQKKPEGDSA